ncbi:Uncharacterized protein YEL023C [Ceratocystis fimbriata CBS 114723]|uniref:Uncharacterized protein YEL023C n=1 Tax=Ceratocystis fimbriata CBS 114723 TaxID=1035309 RepID=A0A2C5WYH3_9PEZI|nr:Uncharacterized protein YEL023C [Ceratocystis fimbriata CBS 114723]
MPRTYARKRLIVCCDGTWMNSDGSTQIPSNVTRMSRCFSHHCSDGTLQIINYQSGVGTGSNMIDSIVGGAFGKGIAERIREAYAFLCTNYSPGDEIVLLGFSRGAFTARSVAGMVASLGLLTAEGLKDFMPIFKDMENWGNKGHKDKSPQRPFSNKPWPLDPTNGDMVKEVAKIYRTRLEEAGLTRIYYEDPAEDTKKLITIKAVAVFDTVGSLGIPQVGWMHRLGFQPSHKEYQFWDTTLSDRIEHAFQALALDETRPPFSPAVWEKSEDDEQQCDLRQVWFPGSHSNCGGGWPDQAIADISMAWMMDQLSSASVGCEFDLDILDRFFQDSQKYSRNLPKSEHPKIPVARQSIQAIKKSIDQETGGFLRPWGFGKIHKKVSAAYTVAGSIIRSPGQYRGINPKDGSWKKEYLQSTNEHIHSSVRVRLQGLGLGLNDAGVWDCPALAEWTVEKCDLDVSEPVVAHPRWVPKTWISEEKDTESIHLSDTAAGRWKWVYQGDKQLHSSTMPEEPLGPIERHLLHTLGKESWDLVESAGDVKSEEMVQPPQQRKDSIREKLGSLWATVRRWTHL